jgi:hypothetical protein
LSIILGLEPGTARLDRRDRAPCPPDAIPPDAAGIPDSAVPDEATAGTDGVVLVILDSSGASVQR